MPVITTLAAIAATAAVNASLAIGFGGLAWTIGAVVQFAVPLALTIGASYAAATLLRTQTGGGSGVASDSPAAVNAPEVRGNVKQSTPPQRVPIGQLRVGGSMFLYEVKPPYLYVGFVYSSFPINDFVRLYIGENKPTFASIPDNTIISPLSIAGEPDWPNRLQLCVQRGALSTTQNALIAADFPELGSRFIHPGCAVCVFKCDYGTGADEFLDLWGNVQIPNFQWELKGVSVPDPRVPSHDYNFDMHDPEELFAAIDTWAYSDVAALTQAYWAMMPFGLGAGPATIDQPALRVAADFDEEAVTLYNQGAGGSQKRYVVSCLATLTDKPNTVMEALFTANRGFASQRAGLFTVYSSQPRDPVMTITDAMLTGAFQFRRLKPKADLINIGSCTYVSPDSEWLDEDGPTYKRADLVASDGEVLEQKVRLPCTPTHQRAQRILKGFVDESRLEKFLTCRVSMRAYGLREGMVVRRYSETGRYSSQDGLYSVEEWQLATDRTAVALSLSEYDPSISRDWVASTDEMPFVREAV